MPLEDEDLNVGSLPADIDTMDTSKLDKGHTMAPDEAGTDEVKTEVKTEVKPDEVKTEVKPDEAKPDEDTVAGAARDAETGRFVGGIPKARFDEVISKSRERDERAAVRIRELEEALNKAAPPPGSVDLKALQEKIDVLAETHAQALLDGKAVEATTAMRDMARLSRQMAEAESAGRATQARHEAAEEIRIDMALAELEKNYPELNEAGEKFDADLSNEVLREATGIQAANRIPMSQALLRAAPKVFLARENVALKAELERLRGERTTPDGDKKVVARTTQVEKNVAAAGATPPQAGGAGMDTDKAGEGAVKVDVTRLSPEEYDALPASTKARLRGDVHIST